MLSPEEWWGIIALYGGEIWPAQPILYLCSLAAAALVFFRPGQVADMVMRLWLALAFAWVSVVFFLVIGRDLAGSTLFGVLFGVVALLLAADLFRRRMTFRLPAPGPLRGLVAVLAVAIFAYPAISLALGHSFPRTIVPGTFPCPTTALGLLMLSLALPRADKIAYVLLLLWAVPLPPVVQIPQYGVYEDSIMLIVGVYALVMLVLHWTGRIHPVEGGRAAAT